MHWCLDYENYLKTKQKTKENIDEIIFKDIYKYNNMLEQLKNIFDSIAEEGKRIIVFYTHMENLSSIVDFLKSYNETYPITILIDDEVLLDHIAPINYFYNITVDNKEWYNDAMEAEVTDIFVGDNLGFCMEHMRKPHKKNIRIIPCKAQASGLYSKYNSFFVRPDDILLYEDFIDTIDLSFVNNASVLADIYILQKKWIGDLSEIISGLPKGFRGDGIIPDFGIRRLNCEKRCQNKGNQCHLCERYANLSQNAKKNGIYFKA